MNPSCPAELQPQVKTDPVAEIATLKNNHEQREKGR